MMRFATFINNIVPAAQAQRVALGRCDGPKGQHL
jgi:hypothetical protein